MPGRPESSTDALRSVSDVARSRRIPSRRAGSKARADGGSPGEGAVAGSDGPAQPVADLAHAIRLEDGEGQPPVRLRTVEPTAELQSLMRNASAVLGVQQKKRKA